MDKLTYQVKFIVKSTFKNYSFKLIKRDDVQKTK